LSFYGLEVGGLFFALEGLRVFSTEISSLEPAGQSSDSILIIGSGFTTAHRQVQAMVRSGFGVVSLQTLNGQG
jgi:hypothetical protein